MSTARSLAPRTALFLPASNARAIAKARTLGADMVILDLEDAVRDGDKQSARAAAVAAVGEGFGPRFSAIRVNGVGSGEHAADVAAVAGSAADFAVLPKVEHSEDAARAADALGKPVLAMIETPLGVLAAAEIAAVAGVEGLIAGTNDLRAQLGIPASAGRDAIALALQAIVLAARAGGGWVIDGVYNALDDSEGLAAECRHGRSLGFDGKALIHPNQIAVAALEFGPSAEEIADALALLEAFRGGAERFRDRMIEAMHVDQARAVIERAER
jgi:citrate lyase subunit beta/citryl-CoA lyase